MDFSTILDQIESEECVLLVGPEMPFLVNNLNRQQQVFEWLKKKDFKGLIPFKEDDFYYFPKASQKGKACYELKGLYKSLPVSPTLHPLQSLSIYDAIAQIPFSLIISLSPDTLLKQSFINLFGYNSFEFSYYKRGETNNSSIKYLPSKNRPVIYNLFGDITQDPDSVILTFDDLFNFFSSIFGDYKLPEKIKSKLQGARSYLFIGFDFHAWYYKLLLRILSIDDSKDTYYCPENVNNVDTILLFFTQHFDMKYSDLNIQEFISKLYDACNNERGILRTRYSVLSFDNENLKKLISSDKLDEAMKLVENYLQQSKDTIHINKFTLISSEYSSYITDALTKTKSGEILDVAKNSIQERILSLGDIINQ